MSPLTMNRRAFVAMTLSLAACKNQKQIIDFSGVTMGTSYNVVVVDHDGKISRAEIQTAIDAALKTVTRRLSNWEVASEVARFNAAVVDLPVAVSDDLARVMTTAQAIHHASDGRFDTTIGPLIDLWGFGAGGMMAVPNSDEIARALEASGQDKTIEVASGTVAKRQNDARIYLAGIGKGFGADRIGNVLETFGIADYLVEIGGDLYASGTNPDGLPWQIGIESPNPVDRSLAKVVRLAGMGLATSGDYRNFFEFDGQRFSHLIDPTTGYPVAHETTSATVLAADAMQADAWSTAMLVLGREHGLKVASDHGVAVHFIERSREGSINDFKSYSSEAFQNIVV